MKEIKGSLFFEKDGKELKFGVIKNGKKEQWVVCFDMIALLCEAGAIIPVKIIKGKKPIKVELI